MSLSRRGFLVTGSLSAAAGALAPVIALPQQQAKTAKADLSDWAAVRRQFDVTGDYIHLGLFYIASHPRPVREAIEQHRRKLDANPFLTVEHGMFESPEENLPLKACNAIAEYIGAKSDDVALTQNTTMGLTLLYQGLPLRAGDEILTTNHDHYVHHEAIRLATERSGATWRKIPLFDSYDAISADEMVDRIRRGIGPKTRVVGVTWVHSSSGLKLPIRRIADAVAEVNRGRGADDRVLLVVDGVHGIGVEDRNIVAMGADAFAAGTHKWIFGPRGTGFVWARPEVWATMRPLIPSFTAFELFQAWASEKAPQGPARANWFTPGGFQAFEHWWALPAAFAFHKEVGYERITSRIHALNGQMKEGLAKMAHVTLYTPRTEALSSGIVCFDVKGMEPGKVVQKLLERKIIASTTPYARPYARVAFGIQNTEDEVAKTIAAVRGLA